MYKKGEDEHLYFVTESKGTNFDEALRPIESGKIYCGRQHFKTINSRMIVAHTIDDVHEQV